MRSGQSNVRRLHLEKSEKDAKSAITLFKLLQNTSTVNTVTHFSLNFKDLDVFSMSFVLLCFAPFALHHLLSEFIDIMSDQVTHCHLVNLTIGLAAAK